MFPDHFALNVSLNGVSAASEPSLQRDWEKTDAWLLGLLAGSLGVKSHPICQAAVGPSLREAGEWQGHVTCRGARPAPQQKWQGAYAAPSRAASTDTDMGPATGSGRMQHRATALSKVYPARLGIEETAALCFCLSGFLRNLGMQARSSNTTPSQVWLWGLDSLLLDFLAFIYRHVTGSS